MENTESILISIKKLLGLGESYTHFDSDIIMHINSVFAILTQMGVGPPNGFFISDEDKEWADFISGDSPKFSFVRSYMYLKVKLLFDPPLSSAAIESVNQQIKEFEWRLYEEADPITPTNREGDTQNGER